MQVAGFFAVVWCINLLLYIFSGVLHIPPYSCPLSLAAFVVLYLLNPFRVLHYRARRWLLRVMVSTAVWISCCFSVVMEAIKQAELTAN